MIIQLSHYGGELKLSRRSKKNGVDYRFYDDLNELGVYYGNYDNKHYRKFFEVEGSYLSTLNNSPKDAFVQFWGEWEVFSKYRLTRYNSSITSSKNHPTSIHNPLVELIDEQNKLKLDLDAYSENPNSNITDPFVFGEKFYYAHTKQSLSGSGKKLLNLDSGSIVIFGSELNRSQFVVDTVFVVASQQSVADYRNELQETGCSKYSNLYRQMTLDLNGGLEDWRQIYTAKMYNYDKAPQEQETFSFVPCKSGFSNIGHPRFIMDIDKYNLKKTGAGSVLHQVKDYDINVFWSDLVKDLFEQGFSLGIKINL